VDIFKRAERLERVPPYLFKQIDNKKAELISRGVDVIDLGVGDPDLPTPGHIIDALEMAARDPANHQYPSYSGMNDFKEAVADWYFRRFGVRLDPETQVISLIGSKEGIAHFPMAFLNPGDIALVPTPAYPVYNIATLFAGGESFFMPLFEKNAFLPDLDSIPGDIASRARILFINYPNNPTAAIADPDFFSKVARFARDNGIIVCHDAAYTEISFDGYRPNSFLEADGAVEVGIEFHSFSKTYNMTGWRIGFAVGNPDAVAALGAIKSNIDSGVFRAVQLAAIKALAGDQTCVKEMTETYKKRRDLMVNGLKKAGFDMDVPKATFYLWVKVPKPYTSEDMTSILLERAGIVVTPGSGFGYPGEGYFRISLTQDTERLEEAVDRLKTLDLDR